MLYVTWYHFTLSSLFPPIFLALQSIFQAIYSNFPLLSHSFPIVLRHIPSFFHCLSHILCYQFILPFHQFSQCFAMVLLDFSSVSNAYPNAPSTIPTVAPYKRFYSIVVTHRNCNFPLLFHCFTHALRDNGPTSESQFYLASFYPLPILSTVSPRVLINFPSVLLKFSIAFPFFSIVLCQSPSFFPLFFSSFSPPFPFLFPLFYVIFPHFFYCFSHHFPLHCNLLKSTSEGGPGGNRYPNVTQLPPGT